MENHLPCEGKKITLLKNIQLGNGIFIKRSNLKSGQVYQFIFHICDLYCKLIIKAIIYSLKQQDKLI